MTFIKNMQLVFCLKQRRWLTPLECIRAMGFPVLGLTGFGETSSFCKARDAYGFIPRSRHMVLEQAGNSFNPTVLGVALLWCLMQHKCPDDIPAEQVRHLNLKCT